MIVQETFGHALIHPGLSFKRIIKLNVLGMLYELCTFAKTEARQLESIVNLVTSLLSQKAWNVLGPPCYCHYNQHFTYAFCTLCTSEGPVEMGPCAHKKDVLNIEPTPH